MVVVSEEEPGFKVKYNFGEKGVAMYGGDGFVKPAMTLREAERLKQSLIDESKLPPDRFDLVPLGEVYRVEESGPSI